MGRTVFTITFFCLCFGMVLSVKRLYQLSDLADTEFGKKFPHNGLLLLYWFSAHVEFNSEDFLEAKDYDPTKGDYGTKTYINRERLLPRIPSNVKDELYYIIGNLKHGGGEFPKYVNQDYYNAYCAVEADRWTKRRDEVNRNRDRVIFRVKLLPSGGHRIAEVYITQTSVSGLRLSSVLTYEVTAQLLKEIKDIMKQQVAILCPSMKQEEEKAHNMFEDQNLAWFLTLVGYNVSRRESCLSNVHCSDYTLSDVGEDCLNHLHCVAGSTENEVCDWNPMTLKVGTTMDGKALVKWEDIPDTRTEEEGLTVALFKNDDSSSALVEQAVEGMPSGSFSTDVPINAGLQVRLLLKGQEEDETIWRGPEMDEANFKRPVDIYGPDATMQLIARDGLAYMRLFVKKSFTNWRKKLQGWTGYHPKLGGGYSTWLYPKNMAQATSHKLTGYDVYEHFFNQTITPDAILKHIDNNNAIAAQTQPWDV